MASKQKSVRINRIAELSLGLQTGYLDLIRTIFGEYTDMNILVIQNGLKTSAHIERNGYVGTICAQQIDGAKSDRPEDYLWDIQDPVPAAEFSI